MPTDAIDRTSELVRPAIPDQRFPSDVTPSRAFHPLRNDALPLVLLGHIVAHEDQLGRNALA